MVHPVHASTSDTGSGGNAASKTEAGISDSDGASLNKIQTKRIKLKKSEGSMESNSRLKDSVVSFFQIKFFRICLVFAK